jgi:hypothetical protein
LPDDIEWSIWRVVTSDITRQSYWEICEHWSFDELDQANCVIDAFELAQARLPRPGAAPVKAGY